MAPPRRDFNNFGPKFHGDTSVMHDSLKSRTVASLGYSLACRLIVFTLSSATAIVLARNLTASDYGIVGLAMIFTGLLAQFSDLGVTASIIQKESISEDELYTAFTLKILLGLAIFALSIFLGSVSLGAFDNPAVGAVIVVLAANLLIGCLGFIPNAVMTRDLRFKRLTIPQIGSQVTASAVAVITVYAGFRYWSIVISNLTASVASVAILFTLCPVSIKLRWDGQSLKRHVEFGMSLFLSGLMVFVLFNADNFVIGAVSGAAVLGFYAIAFSWGTKVACFLSSAIHGVLLSAFSRVQQDTDRLKRGYLTILEYVSFGAVMGNVLLFILSKDLLVLVLGAGTEKWLPALGALDILCAYGIVRAVLEPVGSVIIASGRPDLILKSNAVVAVLQAACLYPGLKYFGIAGVAVVVTLSYSLQFLIYLPALRRGMGLHTSAIFRRVFPSVLSGCVVAAFGFALRRFMVISWFSMILKLSMGFSLYMLTYATITRGKILKDGGEVLCALLAKTDLPPESTNWMGCAHITLLRGRKAPFLPKAKI